MKGLFLASDTPLLGGVVTYIRDVALRLSESGFPVAVGLKDVPSLAPIRRQLSEQGIIVTHPLDTTYFERGYLPVVTGFGPFSYRSFFSTFGENNLVIIVHDQVDIYYPQPFQSLYRLGYRHLQVPQLRRARALITVSDWARLFLQTYYGLSHVYTVKNAVDTNYFRPVESPEIRVQRKQALGISPEKPLVLIPGRLSPEKNPFLALRVARLLPEVHFAYVGSGELEKPLRFWVRVLNLRNVSFLGKRYDMPKIYAAADAVLQPTLGENQSLTTLEAMASGLPVVTTPIPAQREIVSHLETGIISPIDAQCLAEWVMYALKYRDRIGKNARSYVVMYHSLELYVSRFMPVVDQITQLFAPSSSTHLQRISQKSLETSEEVDP